MIKKPDNCQVCKMLCKMVCHELHELSRIIIENLAISHSSKFDKDFDKNSRDN